MSLKTSFALSLLNITTLVKAFLANQVILSINWFLCKNGIHIYFEYKTSIFAAKIIRHRFEFSIITSNKTSCRRISS
jgi:hypothetical protein